MTTVSIPVPYTVTSIQEGRKRNFRTVGQVRAELADLSLDDLQLVAMWHARWPEHGTVNPSEIPGAGRVYWHNGYFLSPVVLANKAHQCRPVVPGELPAILHHANENGLLTWERKMRVYNSDGYLKGDKFQSLIQGARYRPDSIPPLEHMTDDFETSAGSIPELLNSFVVVDGELFQKHSEPVWSVGLSRNNGVVIVKITSVETVMADGLLFRLDRFEDAMDQIDRSWPGREIVMLSERFSLQDGCHLNFDDELYSLAFAARDVFDSLKTRLPYLQKETGLALSRINRSVPEQYSKDFDDLSAIDCDQLLRDLQLARKELDDVEGPILDLALERWDSRPMARSYGF